MGTICLKNLGKAYKLYPTRWSRLAEWVLPFQKPRHQLHWVLQGVDLRVEAGEAVGIIGINGAGKSTLLKMVTGTTQPTTGSVELSGQVAALLELGMGFHPDFTGRQNVYMAGQLLGLSAAELTELMPEIEAFAEIGSYMDQPVRVYSSGMQMRLAFSVATARRPDILIVDEALSVGDVYFQHKSFERIRAFRQQGTTLLLVSHDKAAIQSICDRAVLLDGGRVAKQGLPEEIMDYYNAMIAEREEATVEQRVLADGTVQTSSGTGEARVTHIALYNRSGEPCETVAVGEDVELRVDVAIHAEIRQLVFGYGIKDRLGLVLYGTNTWHTGQTLSQLHCGETVQFRVAFTANLGVGSYSIQTALTECDTHLSCNYEWRDLALVFNVVNVDKPFFVGTLWSDPTIEVLR